MFWLFSIQLLSFSRPINTFRLRTSCGKKSQILSISLILLFHESITSVLWYSPGDRSSVLFLFYTNLFTLSDLQLAVFELAVNSWGHDEYLSVELRKVLFCWWLKQVHRKIFAFSFYFLVYPVCLNVVWTFTVSSKARSAAFWSVLTAGLSAWSWLRLLQAKRFSSSAFLVNDLISCTCLRIITLWKTIQITEPVSSHMED